MKNANLAKATHTLVNTLFDVATRALTQEANKEAQNDYVQYYCNLESGYDSCADLEGCMH